MASMRQKHAKAIEDLSEQLEAVKKVGVCEGRGERKGMAQGQVIEKRKKKKGEGEWK